MSNSQNIDSVVKAVMENKSLKQAIGDLEAAAKAAGMSKAEQAKKLKALLEGAGIEATDEDISSYLRRGVKMELSEDDLDNVSGGCGSDSSDGNFCPECGSRLETYFYQGSGEGGYVCPNCGYQN